MQQGNKIHLFLILVIQIPSTIQEILVRLPYADSLTACATSKPQRETITSCKTRFLSQVVLGFSPKRFLSLAHPIHRYVVHTMYISVVIVGADKVESCAGLRDKQRLVGSVGGYSRRYPIIYLRAVFKSSRIPR